MGLPPGEEGWPVLCRRDRWGRDFPAASLRQDTFRRMCEGTAAPGRDVHRWVEGAASIFSLFLTLGLWYFLSQRAQVRKRRSGSSPRSFSISSARVWSLPSSDILHVQEQNSESAFTPSWHYVHDLVSFVRCDQGWRRGEALTRLGIPHISPHLFPSLCMHSTHLSSVPLPEFMRLQQVLWRPLHRCHVRGTSERLHERAVDAKKFRSDMGKEAKIVYFQNYNFLGSFCLLYPFGRRASKSDDYVRRHGIFWVDFKN